MIKKKQFITIITPTYNRADLIGYAIDSVINQKHTIPFDWEMIVVDDGSIDNTKELVQKYIKKHPRHIKYYRQEDKWNRVGKARNIGIDNMNKNSDYIIFLDSDDELVSDCIYTCLKKWNELKQKWEYDTIFWLAYYCKNQYWKLLWNKNIFHWNKEIILDYQLFLSNTITRELHSMCKSSNFIDNSNFRFPEDITTETVLWSKMRKYFHAKWQYALLLNYEWRIYRIEAWSNQITKSINPERFRKNAIGNERILEIIWDDLLKFWYKRSYAEYFFRAWMNRILYGEKKKWLFYLKKSLKVYFSLKTFVIFLLMLISEKLVLFIYKIYI